MTTCPDGTAHHWMLETPDGGPVRGICKKCGAARLFSSVPGIKDGHQPSATRRAQIAADLEAGMARMEEAV